MSTITRSYRIRAYPNGAQRRLLDRWFGATRWLWNTALGIRSEAYRECGLSLTGNDLSLWLTQWKRTPGHEWLAEIPATVLTQCLRDQDAAFRNFFGGRARYPRFKRKDTSGSVRFQGVGRAWARGTLCLPKLDSLKLAETIPEVTRPDQMTLSCDALGRYHVSFSVEVPKSLLPITHRVVGVDVGLTHLATLSTGEKILNPKRYHARLRYLRQQQRCLARRQKGSRRRAKQRLRVARTHARVRQERQCALHALTTRLVREFDLVFIEDLNVRAMARGIHSRAIHDAAFSEIRRQLTYKSDWYGKILSDTFPRGRRSSFMTNAPKLDAAFVEKQRQRLSKVRAELLAAAGDDEADEDNVRSESAASGSREYEDDAQRLDMLEREGNLVVRDVARLERVDRALKKIEEGTYGLSDQSGQPIPRERLEAVPESIYTFAEEKAREAKR